MICNFILNNKQPVPCENLLAWAQWMETHATERIVRQDRVGDVLVSTVFLGLNHQFRPNGPPILFETLIFGGPLDGQQRRYLNWTQAETGHAELLALAQQAATTKEA